MREPITGRAQKLVLNPNTHKYQNDTSQSCPPARINM